MMNEKTFYYVDSAMEFKEKLKADPTVQEIRVRNESDYTCAKIVIRWR